MWGVIDPMRLTITAKGGASWDRMLRNREAKGAGQTMLFTVLGEKLAVAMGRAGR